MRKRGSLGLNTQRAGVRNKRLPFLTAETTGVVSLSAYFRSLRDRRANVWCRPRRTGRRGARVENAIPVEALADRLIELLRALRWRAGTRSDGADTVVHIRRKGRAHDAGRSVEIGAQEFADGQAGVERDPA
jgi:hypothetical protein